VIISFTRVVTILTTGVVIILFTQTYLLNLIES
jgi:hypothetical protein